jgi:hypothetical protein
MDLEFLRSTGQRKPEPWGTSQPHNAYMERPNTIGLKTRLDSGQITATSSFHQSLTVSPQVLVSPDNMITTSIIQKAFGSDFRPFYPPLNKFKVYCKTNWNVQPVRTNTKLFISVLSLFLLCRGARQRLRLVNSYITWPASFVCSCYPFVWLWH